MWLDMAPAASPDQYLNGSPVDRSIYVFLLAASVVVLLKRRRFVAHILTNNWLIIMFVLYCGMSISWSDYPGVALKRWIKSLGDYAILLILLTERDRTRALQQVFATVAFILMPLSVLLVKYYPELGREYAAHWEATQFFVGIADNKNMLGMVCMVFGLASFWRVLQAWSGADINRLKMLSVHGTVLAMTIWLLLKSDSKTSLSCFVLTAGLIVAHTFSKVARKRFAVHILVATVIVSCFSVLFLDLGSIILPAIGRNSTLTGRTEVWEILLGVDVNPLVGTGFESFWLGKRLEYLWKFPIMFGLNEAHNGYFEVYLNLGFVGLAFLAGLFLAAYRNVLRVLDREPEVGRLHLGFFVIAVIYNFTEAGIRSSDLVWIAFLLAAIALPLARGLPVTKKHAAAWIHNTEVA